MKIAPAPEPNSPRATFHHFSTCSSPNAAEGLRKISYGSQRVVQLSPVLQSEACPNTFFVRVSSENVSQQMQIYRWRTKCSGNLVGVRNFRTQVEANFYNLNTLLRVQVEESKSNFDKVKDLSLTKAISLMKDCLGGLTALLEHFWPVEITEKMIFLSEDGEAKLWPNQRSYINPGNNLYPCPAAVNLEKALQSLILIFKSKCLNTKLSNKLFSGLLQCFTIQEAIDRIDCFEKQQNLFCLDKPKSSASTSAMGSLKSCKSLEFSSKKPCKKKKAKKPAIETSIVSSSNSKSMHFLDESAFSSLQSSKKPIVVSKSQNYLTKPSSDAQISFQNPQKVGCFKDMQILAVSQIMKQLYHPFDDLRANMLQKQNLLQTKDRPSIVESEPNLAQKLTQFSYFASESQPLGDRRDIQMGEQVQNRIRIICQNRWHKNLNSLFQQRNIKESYIEGKQQLAPSQRVELKHLQNMGKFVKESVLSFNNSDLLL